jgi:hypothetical protein
MNTCKHTQNLIDQIIDFDEQGQDYKVIKGHANSCDACADYLLVAQKVSQELQIMTDAEDSLVDSTLASILSLQENTVLETSKTSKNSDSQNETAKNNKKSYWLKPQWANALAASFMLISLIALFPYNSISYFGLAPEILETKNESRIGEVTKVEKEQKQDLQKDSPEQRFESPQDEEFGVELIEVEVDELVSLKKRSMPSKQVLNQLKQAPEPPKMSIPDTFGQTLQRGDMGLAQDMSKPQIPSSSQDGLISSQMSVNGGFTNQTESEFTEELIELEDPVPTGSINRNSELESPNPVTTFKNRNSKNYIDTRSNVGGKKFLESIKRNEQKKKLKEESIDKKSNDISSELEVLDKVVATGSRIRRSDLEPVSPVVSFGIEDKFKYAEKAQDQDNNTEVATNEVASIAEVKAELDRIEDIENTENQFRITSSSGNDIEFELRTKTAEEVRQKNKSSRDQMIKKGAKNLPQGKAGRLALAESPKSDERYNKEKPKRLIAKGEVLENIISNNEAQHYLAELQSLENINYKNSSGYWANTYLPGDSQMRLIHSKLLQDKTQGQDVLDSINPNIQPFDAPTSSAMEVYLSSDHAVLKSQQPTRMRLQVGLQASARKGGHRSAMNIGLVYDSQNSQANKTTQIKKLKALLSALLKSKQAGDKISLTVTGGQGGLVIDSHDFRHGTIQVALNQLLKSDESESISLLQALKIATEKTMKTDDSSASLGSSLLILISDNSLDNEFNAINSLAHKNALNGIPMSTISLDAINQNQLNQLALSGQGHARILQSQDDAKRIIDLELMVSSRAVARALRLKIRLAKGVKLIDVIDSYNLNETQAQKVRDAEQSLDQRLSKNLGITADRGKDEEGIQIVIPSFYAGDTHVILLDVVVTNTGPIADVTMRYKDLLYLNNAVTRKQLTMDSNPKELGPLNLNVIKNILAKRFSSDIQAASQLLKNDNKDQALKKLIKLQKLYQSMRVQFPNWNDDAEIFNDQKLLIKYIKLLQSLSLDQSQQVSFMIDSLQYISWRKSTTTPM